jgi:hypothetical protein
MLEYVSMSTTAIPQRFDEVVETYHTVYVSPTSDWAVLDTVDGNGELVRIVGPGLSRFAERGRLIRVVGRWHDDPEYGPQVKVTRAKVSLDLPETDVVDVLARVPYVGRKRAQLLVDRFGPDAVLDRIDAAPSRVFGRVAGLSFNQATAASGWWRQQRSAT